MSTQTLAQSQSHTVPLHRENWWQRNGGRVAIYVSFTIFVFIVGLPFYYIFVSSITPEAELFRLPPSYFPSTPTLENYALVMNTVPFLTYLKNSLIFAIGSSFVSVLFSGLAAYALARIRFPGSNIVYYALILSVALPQIALLVPLLQTLQAVKLYDTLPGLIIVMSSLILPFTIMTLVSFIQQVPGEIEEAALIDGASTLQVLARIVFPLIRPALVTMFIINFIIGWNELLYPLVFGPTLNAKPLSVGLITLSKNASTYTRPWDMMSAMSVIMVIPILLLVLFGQRLIIAGLSRGALKG
jgi:ABC-type glycerol-3-phosphate transport system permease component